MENRVKVIGRGLSVFDKWQEAIYHCQLMHRNLQSYVDSELKSEEKETYLKHFRYDFNAFVNSSRAVTFVIQKVYCKDQGFDEWYAEKQKILKNNEFAKSVLNLRNLNQKEGNYYPQITLSYKINDDFFFKSTQSGIPVKEHENKKIPNTYVDISLVEIEKKPEEVPKEDIIEMDFPEGISVEEMAELAAPVLINQYLEQKKIKYEKIEKGVKEITDIKHEIVLGNNLSLSIEHFKEKCFDNLKVLETICIEAQEKFVETK